jgi:GTP-binding protein HflX
MAGPERAEAGVLAADMLFATLDPTTRRICLPGGREVLVTDTVGFIQKLPTTLVAAFRATLEEIGEADLLLHVVDITHNNALQQASTVGEVLRDLGAIAKPIITALNKIDLLPSPSSADDILGHSFPDAVPVSAYTGQGIRELLARAEEVLNEDMAALEVVIPYSAGELVSLWHTHGLIEMEEHTAEGVLVRGMVPHQLYDRFLPYKRQRGASVNK